MNLNNKMLSDLGLSG